MQIYFFKFLRKPVSIYADFIHNSTMIESGDFLINEDGTLTEDDEYKFFHGNLRAESNILDMVLASLIQFNEECDLIETVSGLFSSFRTKEECEAIEGYRDARAASYEYKPSKDAVESIIKVRSQFFKDDFKAEVAKQLQDTLRALNELLNDTYCKSCTLGLHKITGSISIEPSQGQLQMRVNEITIR